MNNEDHEVRVECEKLAASARSLEQEVNALNLKIQVLTALALNHQKMSL